MSLTQNERNQNTHEYFKAFAEAQQERNNARHEAIKEIYPWLKGVRDAQKKVGNN